MLRRLGFEKVTFDKKYPLFVDIFTDENTRNNMLANEDLSRKYEANNQVIKTFIFELNKRFDIETVRRIVSDTVLKLPDNLLVSFITSYLNSDEATKSNGDVVSFFNKTLNLGNNCISYIEENGIVANRKYKELPQLLIEEKYKKLRSDDFTYESNGDIQKLDDVFESASMNEKELIIDLLENDSFKHIKPIFERFNFSLKTIISLLSEKGIDSSLINDKVLRKINHYCMMILICFLLDIDNSKDVLVRINHLIDADRIELVGDLIINGLVERLSLFTVEQLDSLSNEVIISKIKVEEIALKKVEA